MNIRFYCKSFIMKAMNMEQFRMNLNQNADESLSMYK